MPKASVLQSDFGAGEVSPLTFGRVASERYKQSLAQCQNYIPILQGPLVRRPGTKYVAPVKDGTNPPTIIPFKFSVTQAYMLEFGDKYIRFYANNGQIISPAVQYQVQGNILQGGAYIGGFGGIVAPVGNFNAIQATAAPRNGQQSINTSVATLSNAILELTTPYAIADVPNIRYTQNADTLYLTHPNYPVKKLVRYAQTEWSLQDVYLQDGPYLSRNSYTTNGDATQIQFTSTAAGSAPGGLTTLSTSPQFTISGMANNGAGLIRVTTSAAYSYLPNQKVFISGVVGTTEANNTTLTAPNGNPASWAITIVDATHFDLQGSTFTHAYSSGGTVQPAIFDISLLPGYAFTNDQGRAMRVGIAGFDYAGVIVQVISAASATFVLDPINSWPVYGATTTTDSWLMSVYSVKAGFPSVCTFHQNRLVLGASPGHPQQIDGSAIGTSENFRPSEATTRAVVANDAYQFVLASTDVNQIKWLKSATQGLLAGTYSAEWSVSPSSLGEALSPLNVNATSTSTYGSAPVDAVQMGGATLYVQRSGKKVRELNYFIQFGTFKSTDLTELSENITVPGVVKLASTNETVPTIWCLRSDGTLLNLIYDRDSQNLRAGWARQPLGGQSDAAGTPPIVLSIAAIPSPDLSFDSLWMVVKRLINGASVVYIEYTTKMFDSSFLGEDAYHLDCGTTFDNPKTITSINISSALQVTAAAHGLAVGDTAIINAVSGLNKSTTDINGVTTTVNLVNYLVFTVGTVVDANNVLLVNSDGSSVTTAGFGAYILGGQLRKRITTISGLTWLAGETVSTWADGAFGPTAQVSSGGVLTMPSPAGKVQIGYSYTSQGQLMRPEAGAADGTSIAKTRRVEKAGLMLQRTAEISIGMNFNRMLPVQIITADNAQAGVAFPLFTGIKRESVESSYNYEGQLCFQQTQCGPGQILATVLFLEEEDI